jgi:hypothetical protein
MDGRLDRPLGRHTLVVETSHFTDQETFRGGTPQR